MIEVHQLAISHLHVMHTIDAFGLIFSDLDGKNLFYSGDTEYFEELGQKIKEADIGLSVSRI